VIHDLEPTPHRDEATGETGLAVAHAHLAELRESGFAALQRLRASSQIQAFGAGMNIDEDGEDPQLKRVESPLCRRAARYGRASRRLSKGQL